MDRVAGEDLEWVDVDGAMLREMADDEIQMAVLSGMGKDGRPFLFRLPVEKLQKKYVWWSRRDSPSAPRHSSLAPRPSPADTAQRAVGTQHWTLDSLHPELVRGNRLGDHRSQAIKVSPCGQRKCSRYSIK